MHTPFTASDFANWVFKREIGQYYKRPIGEGEQRFNPEYIRMRLGYLSHYEIEDMRRNHFNDGWNVSNNRLWSVDYCDTGEGSEVLESSTLLNSFDGRKLRGKPDLVLVNNNDHHTLIVERKTTMKSMEELCWGSNDPSNWPNCRAQLWSYAQLDRYIEAPRVSLILQPWHRDEIGNHVMGHTTPPRVFEKGNEFDQQNLRLFKAYGGMRSEPQ